MQECFASTEFKKKKLKFSIKMKHCCIVIALFKTYEA